MNTYSGSSHSIVIHGKTIMGLSQSEASNRLAHDGPNELPSQKKRNILHIFFDVIKEPMLLMLLLCGGLYFVLGEAGDATMLMMFVIVVIGITFFQEQKTERALEALKNLSSPRATVIRDGQRIKIPGREVVVGDIVFLTEGDRVPADGYMLTTSNMTIDESLLTGEAMPVRKIPWDGTSNEEFRPGGDDLPYVYSGTLVSSGHGILRVKYIGYQTEMGKIGHALTTIDQEEMLLQKETRKLVKTFGMFGGVLCVSVILLYGFGRGNWIEGILSGLTLSMAMLPEEFSVVLLIFLAIGAWRMSKRSVLTRKLPAIETLGAATVLCVDKTGTLTHNTMNLRAVSEGSTVVTISETLDELPENIHDVIEYGLLASQRDPFDPIEKEIKRVAEGWLQGTEHIHNNWSLVQEYPLTKELLALSHVWQSPDKKDFKIAAKGAPEAILDLCHANSEDYEGIEKTIQKMASDGLRVLAIAKASFTKVDLPKIQHDFEFKFVGLVGFVDPIRETVPHAVKTAYEAGMNIVMITGDYPVTAQHIAKQIGLSNPAKYLTGKQLDTMNKDELRKAVRETHIFARVVPEQKLAIVNAYKANGDIVAMTGDGVNDAPALKAAHIGIAMGERGTDVAREAASLVLLDDDFTSIVAAVRLGRRIFDNLRKAMAYILSVHIPIAGLSFLPIVFGMPTLLLPAHIAFLELIIDPACSVVFESEPEEDDVMKRSPRKLTEPMMSRKTYMISILQGFSVLMVILGLYGVYMYLGKGIEDARTLAFVSLVISNILLIILNLSWKKSIVSVITIGNKALVWVSLAALIALLSVLYIQPLQQLFRFSTFHADDWGLAIAGAVVSLLWFEMLKYSKVLRVL